MHRTLDDLDSRLLNLIQEEVPLVDRPFSALGQKLGVDEAEVLRRVAALKAEPHPVIRQISAIFDTKALGYTSSLVAARIEPARLAEAAEVIGRHPGVSHNYQRNHAYNLWYTVAVPPHSRFGLQGTIDILHQESGALKTRPMPTLKLYKIGVKLNLGGDADLMAQSDTPRFREADRKEAMSHSVTDADKRMIRVLQQDLPIIARPYDAWAEEAKVTLEELFRAGKLYEQQKRMRRFSAVLHHREAGFRANGMGVWVVPPSQQERFGEMAGSFDAVSHCYLRPTYEDWPYTLFTMVHAPKKADCDRVLAVISQATGITEYAALYSMHEYKKTRVQYFLGDIEAWEQERAGKTTKKEE